MNYESHSDNNIAVPIYKTGQWNEDIQYLNCVTKIVNVEIPEDIELGWDDERLWIGIFGINLN